MMRSIPVEWGLFGQGPWDYSTNAQFIYNFWVNGTIRAEPFENIITVGMRGDGDRKYSCKYNDSKGLIKFHVVPAAAGTNIALLEKIISDQRQIISNVYNTTDVTNIPQVWTLCEHFQALFLEGN